jgi:AbiTii
MVRGREDTLIEQIERDALDDSVPVATALRKCVVLGGRSGSEQLRDWATRELKGYQGDDDLPAYRVVAAPLRVDGVAGNYHVTRQAFPPSALPDFARDKIKDEVELRDGVGSIEALLQMDEIKLSPPMASDLVRYMNAHNQQAYQHIESLYWQVSHAAIRGLLDQVRTSLTQLVAELRAISSDHAIPSAEAANQAVNVVVTGKRSQVHVATAQASGSHTVAKTSSQQPQIQDSPFWTRSRRIGAFVVGLATVAGAVVAIIELF